MTSFNSGLQGMPNGSAQSWAGWLISQSEPASEQDTQVKCQPGELRWHSESPECFVPTQFHINALLTSLLFNLVMLVVIVAKLSTKTKQPTGSQ